MSLVPTPSGMIGPYVIGAFCATYLSGVVWAQGVVYFRQYPKGKDRNIFPYAVFLLVMDVVSTCMACATVWIAGVGEWGDFSTQHTAVVQIFYAYRCYIFGKKSLYIPILVCFLAMVQLAFACGAAYSSFRYSYANLGAKFSWGVYVWLLSAMMSDFIIAAAIVFHLRNAKLVSQKAGMSDTQAVISRMIFVTIESNLGTALVALIDAILFALVKDNAHCATNIILVKLYLISFLYSLTARANYKGADGNAASNEQGTTSGNGFKLRTFSGARERAPVTVMVAIETDVNDGREDEEWNRKQEAKLTRPFK